MTWQRTDTFRGGFATVNASGEPADADAPPTAVLYADGVATADVVTVAALGSGSYVASVPLTGRANGETCQILATWAMGASPRSAWLEPFRVGDAGRVIFVQATEDGVAADEWQYEFAVTDTAGDSVDGHVLKLDITGGGGESDPAGLAFADVVVAAGKAIFTVKRGQSWRLLENVPQGDGERVEAIVDTGTAPAIGATQLRTLIARGFEPA